MFKAVSLAAVLLLVPTLAAGPVFAGSMQLAASNQQGVCFQNCLNKYGNDGKAACAMQCGLANSPNMGAQNRDCGAIYKTCMRGCGKDKACKSRCRDARRSCI